MPNPAPPRRRFRAPRTGRAVTVIRSGEIARVLAVLAVPLCAACGSGKDLREPSARTMRVPGPAEGRLTARPEQRSSRRPATGGIRRISRSGEREALVLVPRNYTPRRPHGLVLTLHGAHGSARLGFGQLRPLADDARLILLSPKSARSSWDLVRGGFGPDVGFIDRLLERAFVRYAIDPDRVAIAGFSDGASYALSLGLGNGDLFSKIVAFSPGFAHAPARRGKPRLFVTHGAGDDVLPPARTSRPLVAELRRSGYDVEFETFKGGHTVPPPLARKAVAWLG
jgi:phospholipase/carboxylesterase